MPDEFDDALDRLDVTFEDFESAPDIAAALDRILGYQFGGASGEQVRIATERFQGQAERAREAGVTITRFQRGGELVTQLRDMRGRFVTAGPRNISDFLRRTGPFRPRS